MGTWISASLLAATIIVTGAQAEPVQPMPETRALISTLPGGDEDRVVIRDGLPFFRYYALRGDARHVFHPMALGRFIKERAGEDGVAATVNAARRAATELPNGGLAWFYPAHYRVARMLGPYLRYSAISQGTILAGLTAAGNANPEISFDLARKAFLALQWPFEECGVNFADRAYIEMPSCEGPPEIILNGWIDALLHVNDYAEATGDPEAKAALARNLAFLAETLPNFDAGDISRYSDLSPYRLRVTLERPDHIDSLRVEYRPKRDDLPGYAFDLERTPDPDDFSPYDNQTWRVNGRIAHVWVGCSQLYETVISSASPSMTVEVDTGKIRRRSTTPGYGGRKMVREGKSVSLDGLGLICGFPTAFSKEGKTNYYHVYHVVGLLMLAASVDMDEDIRAALVKWALKWRDDMDRFPPKLAFEDPQEVLRRTNGNQASVRFTDFDRLLDAATQ